MNEPSLPDAALSGWRFDNTYAQLSSAFYTRLNPTPVQKPGRAIFNESLALALGLDAKSLGGEEGIAIFSGNRIPDGADPMAQAYAGHQFGHFTMLGDGRAIVLGEHVTPGGARVDIQLKGSGPTPYSRRGDGRAALGPMLREYIISEAMHALGIPTTRSLAVVTTGQTVLRERPLPGAVLTRVAASHVRVGTFEYAAARNEIGDLKRLADYTLQRHDPDLIDVEHPYVALLGAVVERQAALVAQWLHVGFIHGVMNTDNVALSGETIDYGPCAFMDRYDPATVFSSIDRQGRYAYGQQPNIMYWNLARFAESLLPLFHEDKSQAIAFAEQALHVFPARFQAHWLKGMRAKLGLFTEEEEDVGLIDTLQEMMQATKADYTRTFSTLSSVPDEPLDSAWKDWHARWKERLARQPQPVAEVIARLQANNPAVIPRNHQVEEVLTTATEGDLAPLHRLLAVLAHPYDYSNDHGAYAEPPPNGGSGYQTFCGT